MSWKTFPQNRKHRELCENLKKRGKKREMPAAGEKNGVPMVFKMVPMVFKKVPMVFRRFCLVPMVFGSYGFLEL